MFHATPRSAVPATGPAEKCSCVTVTFCHRCPRCSKAGRDPGPAFIRELGALEDGLLLLVLGESGVHFVFLDARRGIAGLTEILLFGAVAHHAGMRRGRRLFAVFGVGALVHVVVFLGMAVA